MLQVAGAGQNRNRQQDYDTPLSQTQTAASGLSNRKNSKEAALEGISKRMQDDQPSKKDGRIPADELRSREKSQVSAEEWTEEMALAKVDKEFAAMGLNGIEAGTPVTTHALYDPWSRTRRLVSDYFEEEKRKSEGNTKMTPYVWTVTRRVQKEAKKAAAAYLNGGSSRFRGRPKHWAQFLPDQAEVLAVRFVDRHGAANGTIMGNLAACNSLKRAQIGGLGSDNARTVAIASSAAAAAADAQKSIGELAKSTLRSEAVKQAIGKNNEPIFEAIERLSSRIDAVKSRMEKTASELKNKQDLEAQKTRQQIERLETAAAASRAEVPKMMATALKQAVKDTKPNELAGEVSKQKQGQGALQTPESHSAPGFARHLGAHGGMSLPEALSKKGNK